MPRWVFYILGAYGCNLGSSLTLQTATRTDRVLGRGSGRYGNETVSYRLDSMAVDQLAWFGYRKGNTTFKFILTAFVIVVFYQLYFQLQKRGEEHSLTAVEQRSAAESQPLQSIARRDGLHGVNPDPKLSQADELRHLSSRFQAYSNNETLKNASIINPHPYTFILNNPDKCEGENVFLLIVVTTSPSNHDLRRAIRETWGNESNVHGVVIKRIFAVGMVGNTSIQEDLEKENSIHKDMIQENFVDSYRNLTLKTIMVWKWAFQYCPQAKYVMKTDDDAFVNVYKLVNHLGQLEGNDSRWFVTGRVYTDTKPVRDPTGSSKKWFVTREEYRGDTYPRYPCGCAYVLSNDLTKLLFEASLATEYLFIEDVYLGICLEKLGVDVVDSDKFWSLYVGTLPCSPQFDFIATHWVKTPQAMMTSWKALNTNCKKSFFGLWDILRDLWYCFVKKIVIDQLLVVDGRPVVAYNMKSSCDEFDCALVKIQQENDVKTGVNLPEDEMLSKMWNGRGKIGVIFNVVLILSIVIVYHQLYLIFQQRGRRAERLAVIRSQIRYSRDLSNNGTGGGPEETIRDPGNVKKNSNKISPPVKSDSGGAKNKEKAETKSKEAKVWPKKGSDNASSQVKQNWQKRSPPGEEAKGKETKNGQEKVVPPVKPNPGPPAKPNPEGPAKPNPGAAKPNPGAPAKPNPGAAKPNPGGPGKPNPGIAKPNPAAPAKPNPGAPAKPNPGAPAKPNPGAPAKPNPGAPAKPNPGAANPYKLAPVNPHPYYFTINHPYKCEVKVFLLIIVTSSPQNIKQRQSIRQTWGNETNVPGVAIKTLFAIGKPNNIATQQALQQEDNIYHDIIQENFVDSYHNLTHKTIMCLKYAFKFCPKAKYLLKTDDDTFVNVFNLVAYLKELGKTKKERIVVGEVWREGKPIQEQRRKWTVPSAEYPRESYPKYPNGFAYVISNDITWQVYQASENIKNFFLEDVYIGLCLEKLGIDLIDNVNFYNYFVDIDPCRHQKLIASHWVKEPAKMVKLWNATKRKCARS
ncbi:uncharacterized protein [Branchiostoma lanceolatum]|uniref:uncharacterized protein n=1 Tax=Branchiostoma lanceolatum TaxID=7740 RepID=UPI003453044C